MARSRPSLVFTLSLIAARLSPSRASVIERQSDPNPYISSGTCYTGKNTLADSSYIPCGNTAFGNFACCEQGSVCLEDNACFSYLGSGDGQQITYVAGCTDPNYSDPSCPTKGQYSSQEWSGLVYCGGTSDEWTLCSASSTEVAVALGCVCPSDPSSRDIAFNAGSTIQSILTLPPSGGGSLTSIATGYNLNTIPTTTSNAAAATTSSSAAKTSSSSSAAVSTSTSSSSSSSSASSTASSTSTSTVTSTTSSTPSGTASASSPSLSTGAKAGIGAGAAVAGILLIGLLILLALWYRRRSKRRSQTGGGLGGARATSEISPMPPIAPKTPYHDQDTHYAGGALGAGTLLPHEQQQQQQHQQMQAQRGASPAWSSTDNRSELPTGSDRYSGAALSTSSPQSVQQSWSRPMSEADGTAAGGYGAGYNTYQSMRSQPSQELSDTSTGIGGFGRGRGGGNGPAYQPLRRPDVGVRRVPVGGSTTSGSSYQPGRDVGEGVYEMPAHLPGSTMY